MFPSDNHPTGCPDFEYANHPDRALLPQRVAVILLDLRAGRTDSLVAAADTRKVHRTLFEGLTPPDHPYFAGHYRGEDFRCLRHYRVQIGGREGCPPRLVPGNMEELAKQIQGAITALDTGHKIPNAVIPPELKLLHTVQVACRFFELVCRVHPYANGNGHAARFCLWAILVRYGYYPAQWPIEPRPPDPPYTQMLVDYRNGIRDPLEQHILRCLAD